MELEYMLHPDGFLMEPAPFGEGFMWIPSLPVLGSGAAGQVARYAAVAEGDIVDGNHIPSFLT